MSKHIILSNDLEKSDIDIMSLSETWLTNSDTSSLISIPGYSLARQDRASLNTQGHTKAGGGLAIYAKSHLDIDYESLKHLNTNNCDMESQWLIINRGPNTKNIYICNVYRPPSGNIDKGISTISHAIDTLTDLHKYELVILGDLNIDISDKKSAGTRKINQLELNNQLTQQITTHTRLTQQTRTTIDLILTRMKFIHNSGTLDYFISDHLPVYIIKKKERDTRKNTTFRGRIYRNYTKKQLHRELDQLQVREKILTTLDVNIAWSYLHNAINQAADIIAPIKEHTVKEKRPHWLSNELLELARLRDQQYTKFKITNEPQDLTDAKKKTNTITKYDRLNQIIS